MANVSLDADWCHTRRGPRLDSSSVIGGYPWGSCAYLQLLSLLGCGHAGPNCPNGVINENQPVD